MQKSNKKSRKTHSDKFPLTLHKTGQYCKKIKGKIYYFGTNKRIALQRYYDQAAFLHAGKAINPKLKSEWVTVSSGMALARPAIGIWYSWRTVC